MATTLRESQAVKRGKRTQIRTSLEPQEYQAGPCNNSGSKVRWQRERRRGSKGRGEAESSFSGKGTVSGGLRQKHRTGLEQRNDRAQRVTL